ncbi:dolichol kinase isoform X2 [Malaya genurostris]|nr:dolichol kinase isoform X2 [Malaya genurostris]
MMIISCHFILLLRYSICFWMLFLIVTTGAMLFPLHGKPTLQILLQFVFSDMQRILLVALYLTLLSIASIFVLWQMKQHGNANTAFRKVFHVLILLVYFPGLLCQCNLLYVASGGMLALLFLLETARIIKLNPLHEMLEAAVRCFVDDKDTGVVALTPIYLLVGCSLPMWLHPVPCDLTDSAGLNMIKLSAGVLSVGIGDTFASVCGYYIGKHKWPGSTKSVEGTLANAIAQLCVVFVLLKLRLIHLTVSKAAITGSAIITNVIVEAKTNQVDNLVLPLVTYIILGIV